MTLDSVVHILATRATVICNEQLLRRWHTCVRRRLAESERHFRGEDKYRSNPESMSGISLSPYLVGSDIGTGVLRSRNSIQVIPRRSFLHAASDARTAVGQMVVATAVRLIVDQ